MMASHTEKERGEEKRDEIKTQKKKKKHLYQILPGMALVF